MNIKPTKSRILVREIDTTQEKTAAGVWVMRALPTELIPGIVLAVGPETPSDVTPGCKAWFRRSCGREVGEGCLILEYDMLEYCEEPEDSSDTIPAPPLAAE